MAGISAQFNTIGASRSGLVIGVLVVIAVLALFFLPEIIQMKRTVGTATTVARTVSQLEDGAGVSVGHMFKRDIAQLEGARSRARESAEEPTERSRRLFDDAEQELSEYQQPVSEDRYREAAYRSSALDERQQAPRRELSWETLRSEPVVGELREAQRIALELHPVLNRDERLAKFALLNFSDGVTRVLSEGTADWMTAREALLYLDRLDKTASQYLGKVGAPREIYDRWAEVSYAKSIRGGTVRAKQAIRPAFDPHFTLDSVEVTQPGLRQQNTIVDPSRPPELSLDAYLENGEIDRVQIFRNGTFLREIKLVAVPEEETSTRRYLDFAGKKLDARGLYTFVVYSREGEPYSRSYSFYNRVRDLRWHQNRYLLPYGKGDQRLDKFFAVSTYVRSPYELRFGAPQGTQF